MSYENVRSETVLENHTDSGDWAKVWPDERFTIRIPPADSDRRYTTLELVGATNAGPPLHIHHNEDEHFVILEGSVHFRCGGESFDVSAGSSLTVPKGVIHTWTIRSERPARMLITFSPAGFEEAFKALVGASASEAEGILNRYGCTIEGGKLAREPSIIT